MVVTLASLGSSHWIVTENGRIQAQVGKSDTEIIYIHQSKTLSAIAVYLDIGSFDDPLKWTHGMPEE